MCDFAPQVRDLHRQLRKCKEDSQQNTSRDHLDALCNSLQTEMETMKFNEEQAGECASEAGVLQVRLSFPAHCFLLCTSESLLAGRWSLQAKLAPARHKAKELQEKFDQITEAKVAKEAEVDTIRVPEKRKEDLIRKHEKEAGKARECQTKLTRELKREQAQLADMIPQLASLYGDRVHDPERRSVQALESDLKRVHHK